MGESKKEYASKRLLTILVWVLTIVVVATSLGIVFSRMIKYSRMKQTIEEQKKHLEDQKEQVEELEYWLDSPVDYDYIIKVAREQIGLHFPDEEIYYKDGSNN